MTAYDIILKKKRGGALSEDEIRFVTEGFVEGAIPDYQMSALLMAICFNSMTDDETAALTMAMMKSGDIHCPSKELGQLCIDKHSTGGVGDKVTLIAAPICAACGVYVPKMSGRGLGHTGGTIDKLESIPGLRTDMTHDEFLNTVRQAGFSVSCQTGSLVPADKKIYALRDATATVDSIPLICSSIMSKKLATGADGIVLDVKCGDGAFMKNTEQAQSLAEIMIRVAKMLGRKCTVVITDMSRPLGKAIGLAVEVTEAADVLAGRITKGALYEAAMTIAAEMLVLAGLGNPEECYQLAENAVASGKALEAFERMIALQGGDPQALHNPAVMGTPSDRIDIICERDGYISKICCEDAGLACTALGGGRTVKDAPIDHTAGIIIEKTVGDAVKCGDILCTAYTSTPFDREEITAKLKKLFVISDEAPKVSPAVIRIIR